MYLIIIQFLFKNKEIDGYILLLLRKTRYFAKLVMDSYTDVYLRQFFSTLGQLSAVCVSSAVVVPMWNYYKLNGVSVFSRVRHVLANEWEQWTTPNVMYIETDAESDMDSDAETNVVKTPRVQS